MIVEKNDVDIDKLFTWGKVYVFENWKGDEEAFIYMRLLGDADVNRARVYALRKSAELRKELSDLNSDLRWATIKQIDAMEQEDIINYILVFSMRDITNNAVQEVRIPAPKPPKSKARLSALEKYQKEIDEYPQKRLDAVNKIIKRETESLKTYLATEPKETLYRRYVNTLIDEFCERKALEAYADMECYLGCYKDDEYKERFFSSFEKFDNLLEDQKNIIKTAYSKLGISTDDLKKLREVTP
jgi:hypothetical protein